MDGTLPSSKINILIYLFIGIITFITVLLIIKSENANAYSPTDVPRFVEIIGSEGSGEGQYINPERIALDNTGLLYVADQNNTRIMIFDGEGNYYSQFGSNGSGDGQFALPMGITFDENNNAYIVDRLNHRVSVFKNQQFFRSWGSNGSGDGEFNNPMDICYKDGYLFVVEREGDRIQKFTTAGTFVSKWGSSGSSDGEFNLPRGIWCGVDEYIYIADQFNDRIQVFSDSGDFIKKFGTSGSGAGQLSRPGKAVTDSEGYIYVSDTLNNRVQKYDNDGNYLALVGGNGTGNGQFTIPTGLYFDIENNRLYTSQNQNDRIQLFAYPDIVLLQTNGTTIVNEASRDSYTVKLNAPPTADVTLQITYTNPDEGSGITISPTILFFTTLNWDEPQTITVTGNPDNSQNDQRSINILHITSSSDLGYQGLSKSLTVLLNESDIWEPREDTGDDKDVDFEIVKIENSKIHDDKKLNDYMKAYTKDNKPKITFEKAKDITSGISRYQIRLTDLEDTGQQSSPDYEWIGGINPAGENEQQREYEGLKIKYKDDYIEVTPKDDKYKISNGMYLIKVRAYDNAGNYSDTDNIKLIISDTPPSPDVFELLKIGNIKYSDTYRRYYYTNDFVTFQGKVDRASHIQLFINGIEAKEITNAEGNQFEFSSLMSIGTNLLELKSGSKSIKFDLVIDPIGNSIPESVFRH